MQSFREPSGQAVRRHLRDKLAWGRQWTRGLTLRQYPAESLADLRSSLQDRREVIMYQLVDRGRDQRDDLYRGRSAGQHADLPEMVARSDPQQLDLAFAFLARERQDPASDDEQRV